MIISHAYKYIFLTTRKTGSTSSALYLLQNLFEEGDISIRDFSRDYSHPKVIKPIPVHIPTNSIAHWDMRYLIEDSGLDISNYRVFATLRDPYERLISRAFYRDKGNCKNIFQARQALSKGYIDEDDRDWPQSAYFKYNNEVLADVWDYKKVSQLLPTFVQSYGKKPTQPLQYLKSSDRPAWATIDNVITPQIKQKIDEVFAEDVDLYNRYIR